MPYEDEEARKLSAYDQILVLATTEVLGVAYAEAIGLTGYRVVTDRRHTQGSRCKTLVVTPGYVAQELPKFYEGADGAFDEFYDALRGTLMTETVFG